MFVGTSVRENVPKSLQEDCGQSEKQEEAHGVGDEGEQHTRSISWIATRRV